MPVLGAQTCQGIQLLRLVEYSFSCCFSLTCSAASWEKAPWRVKPNRARVVNKRLCDSIVLRPLGVYARKEMALELKQSANNAKPLLHQAEQLTFAVRNVRFAQVAPSI